MLFESKDTASKEDTQSQQQMPGQQTGMYAGYANGTSIDDDQDEMPRISLSSTATASLNSNVATGIVVNAINNCPNPPTSVSIGMGASSSSSGNPITASLNNIGSAVNSSSGSNSNSNNTTSSRRSVR